MYFISLSFVNQAQSTFFEPADSLNKGRTIGVSCGIGTAWFGGMTGLWQVWYAKVDLTSWHTFDDTDEWLQMDKAGHFYTANKITSLTSGLYKWSGLRKKQATWIGAGIGFGFQTTLEVFDAHTLEWGFSWGDMAANTLGCASYLTQDLLWEEQRFIPKFSTHPTEFASIRPTVLGSNFAESLLKDYNGQTYWLSVSPGSFFKDSKIPKWICLSFGYSINARIVGDEPYYFDETTGNAYYSQREFLLSLDVDFTKINVRKPWLRVLLNQLNYLKVPFPALVLRDKSLMAHPFYF